MEDSSVELVGGIDPKAEERRFFRDVYLKSPNGKMFSENVVEEIIAGLEEVCGNP